MTGQSEILSASLLEQIHIIVRSIRDLGLSHPTRVAIDGFCASGKSTVSKVIADAIRAQNIPVIMLSTDDFQNPPKIRWRLGENSPEGFYRDSIDEDALVADVLAPLGANGSKRYRTSSYDIFNLRPHRSEEFVARSNTVVLIDGLFLHVDALRSYVDYSIYMDAPFDTCVRRAIDRNQERVFDSGVLRSLYSERYVPGYQMYLDEVDPKSKASAVLRND